VSVTLPAAHPTGQRDPQGPQLEARRQRHLSTHEAAHNTTRAGDCKLLSREACQVLGCVCAHAEHGRLVLQAATRQACEACTGAVCVLGCGGGHRHTGYTKPRAAAAVVRPTSRPRCSKQLSNTQRSEPTRQTTIGDCCCCCCRTTHGDTPGDKHAPHACLLCVSFADCSTSLQPLASTVQPLPPQHAKPIQPLKPATQTFYVALLARQNPFVPCCHRR
jgi:hypothetical protein